MVSKELQERGNPAGMDYAFLGEALKVGQQLAYVGVPFDFEKTQQTGARALADQAEFALAQDVAKGTLSKLEKLKADLGGSPEIDRLIGELQLALASGNLQSIRELSDAALATIRSEVAARNAGDDAPESPQQRIDRALHNMEQIAERSKRTLEAFEPYMSDEHKDKRAEADRRVEEARRSGNAQAIADAEVARAAVISQIADEVVAANPHVPGLADAATALKRDEDQIRKERDDIIKAARQVELENDKANQAEPSQIRASRLSADADRASATDTLGTQDSPTDMSASANNTQQLPAPARGGLIAGLSWNNAAADEVSVPPPPAAIPSSETVRSV